MIAGILFSFLNIVVIIFGYFIIKSQIKKQFIKKEILDDVKKEINSIIIQLNEATLNNISLVEEKLKTLDKRIILADKKARGLNKSMEKTDITTQALFTEEQMNAIYTPQKVVKQSQKVTENFNINSNKREILEEIKDLSVIEKATYLLEKEWSFESIQKEIGISSGELELLVNINGNS